MNPEAEKLRGAMRFCDSHDNQQWLYAHSTVVAKLVEAAMDVSWHETADNPDAAPLAGEEVDQFLHGKTGRKQAADALRRLARAVVDFKGPQGPPEPDHDHVDVLRCPHHSCMWWVAKDRGSLAKYQDHYREQHSEREPQSWGKTAERLSGEHHGRGQEWA